MKKMLFVLTISLMSTICFAEEVCFKHPTVPNAVLCCEPTDALTNNGVVSGCPVIGGTLTAQTVQQIRMQITVAQQNVARLQAKLVKAQSALAK